MKVVAQLSKEASVTVREEVIGKIGKGFMLLVGITHEDTEADLDYIVNKLIHLRVFEDADGKMNESLLQIGGEILSISQFTLYADTRKGRRPSFTDAAKPDIAIKLYEQFNQKLTEAGIHVETGEFGAHMDVQLINEGPITIILDSADRPNKEA
ncbi:D-aminoacyl-tRNA deacylase [Terribacillus saccharophilus]|uniref:D-aminoacyl-tRNA deacylase n=1 Tax=Terribacillus saccharophilus TaxID=361277 RepID=A0A268ACR9_9BACI|nr:D-aminoacyl-tRNA deacylase [Terribacillus saccharophilus]PAD21908.1 D-tyrosyl-tRNA(Tyr) deacylase [Terribacillus saccharophilus]PAF21944.1 D-tyrosyl-tRNA(Tyr) deacylase [Terribacillus saccharophilus]